MAMHMKRQERDGLAEGGIEDDDVFSEMIHGDEGASEMGKLMRKRGHARVRRAPSVCSSARGSSIAVSGLRLRRASQLAGKRRGPSTPVPSWKLVGDVESAEVHHHHHQHHQVERPYAATVSARRLAATLWELQVVPFARGGGPRKRDLQRHYHTKSPSAGKPSVNLPHSPASSRMSHMFFKPTAIQNKIEASRRAIPSVEPAANVKGVWKDLVQGPATSSEFLKVLNHVRSLEEQHKSSVSLIESLRSELGEAHMQLQELLQNEKAHRNEVEDITKKLIEERAMWQERQEESVRLAAQSIKEEHYHERKAKSRLESLHNRMVREFQELKKALGKASHDLERERKARELMEDVCDELAREIGEDKARVEEMKRESAKVREEVEEERKMLQMAEIWREERVQMKLMEAKLELEEKNTALDKLRGELEAFLKAKRAAATGNHTPIVTLGGVKGHANEAVLGRNLAEPFHPSSGVRAPARHSIDSRLSSVSRPKQRLEGLEEDEGSSAGEDDLHLVAISNEAHAKQEAAVHRGRFSYHHTAEVDDRERRSSNQRVSTSEQSKQWQGGRYQGLQRSRSSQLREGSRHRDHYLADMQGSQWVEDTGELGDAKKWTEDLQQASPGDEHEETINEWLSENEGSQGHSSFSPKPGGRKGEQYKEVSNLESSGTNAAWLRQIVESSRDLPATSVFAPMHQQLFVKSSPTRHWNHVRSSLDPGSPRQMRGKGISETSSSLRDNSLKAKLMEAKLEGQQARFRSGMG